MQQRRRPASGDEVDVTHEPLGGHAQGHPMGRVELTQEHCLGVDTGTHPDQLARVRRGAELTGRNAAGPRLLAGQDTAL